MAKKSEYKCPLYEKGDKLKSKSRTLFGEMILEVEDTELKYVGIFPTLFIKFVGRPRDITDLSHFFEPAAETIEKYKDGLVYFNETKAKAQQEKSAKTGAKVHSGFGRRLKQDNTLTEEDLKFKIIKRNG